MPARTFHPGPTRRRAPAILWWLPFILILAPLTARSQELPSCPGKLLFGLIPDGLPATRGPGINAELVAALGTRSRCPIELVEMPALRVEEELRQGRLHMSARFFETPERARFAWFAHFQATRHVAAFVPGRLKQPLRRASDLLAEGGPVMGVVLGFRHGPAIDAMLAEVRARQPARITEFADRATLHAALLAGRVDVIFMPPEVLARLRRPGSDPPVATVDVTPDEPRQTGGLVLSRALFDAREAGAWRALVRRLCEDGTVLAIFRRHFEATREDLACDTGGRPVP